MLEIQIAQYSVDQVMCSRRAVEIEHKYKKNTLKSNIKRNIAVIFQRKAKGARIF